MRVLGAGRLREVMAEIAAQYRNATGPEYGLAILNKDDRRAADLALFILSSGGQQILARFGFASVALPMEGRTPDR